MDEIQVMLESSDSSRRCRWETCIKFDVIGEEFRRDMCEVVSDVIDEDVEQ